MARPLGGVVVLLLLSLAAAAPGAGRRACELLSLEEVGRVAGPRLMLPRL